MSIQKQVRLSRCARNYTKLWDLVKFDTVKHPKLLVSYGFSLSELLWWSDPTEFLGFNSKTEQEQHWLHTPRIAELNSALGVFQKVLRGKMF